MNVLSRIKLRTALVPGILLAGLGGGAVASAQTISISNGTYYGQAGPWASTAVYVLSNSGDIIASAGFYNQTADWGDWISPKSGMSNYMVRAIASSCSGPAVGTWVNLGSSPNWHVTASGGAPAYASCGITLEIAAVGNPSVILDSAGITLIAQH